MTGRPLFGAVERPVGAPIRRLWDAEFLRQGKPPRPLSEAAVFAQAITRAPAAAELLEVSR